MRPRSRGPYTLVMTGQRADALDTRLVYRVYAGIAGIGGLILLFWGPMWLGTDLPEQPWGKAALIRMGGAILMAMACLALAFAAVDDPLSRRRGLAWFSIAHCMVMVVG